MPYRHEGSFSDWLTLYYRSHSNTVSPRHVEYIIKQAADALQYAHNHGIIHLDVKPSNFLIHGMAENPGKLHLQLADFGVARLLTTTSDTQNIRGTPIYMAPEQWDGHPVPATDQYALAVMAYELLVGHPPFPPGTHQQLWHQHCHIPPPPLSGFNRALPPDLDPVLTRALAKHPDDRFRSISSFSTAFRRSLLNIYITLTITPQEAQRGTIYPVTLQDGREVTVIIQAGAYQGQIIRMKGQGVSSDLDERPGALIIAIDIQDDQDETSLLDIPSTQEALPYFHDDENPQPSWWTRSLTAKVLLCFIIVVLLIGSSLGIAFLTHDDHTSDITVVTTRTLQTITATTNKIATSQAQTATALQKHNAATASAYAQSSATAQSYATATSIAQSNASATANAHATATSIAQLEATATTTSYINQVRQGTPLLADPIHPDDQQGGWDTTFSSGQGCTFITTDYHSISSQTGGISSCMKTSINFTNFAYEVLLTIVKGDRAGIAFRANKGTGNFYYFSIGQNGTCDLSLYNTYSLTKTLYSGHCPQVHPNQQPNLLTVIANNTSIELFVNMTPITTLHDSTYTQGQIGVVAEDVNSPTDATFTSANVWGMKA